jgi:hypothetical protein
VIETLRREVEPTSPPNGVLFSTETILAILERLRAASVPPETKKS